MKLITPMSLAAQGLCLLLVATAAAQDAPPAPEAEAPPDAPPTEQPPPIAEQPAAPPAEPPPPIAEQPASTPQEPPPAPQPQAPPPQPTRAAPPPPPPPPPQQQRYAPEGGYAYTPPPDDPAYGDDDGGDGGDDGEDFEIPGFSIKLDPFNWLIAGRLGLELEVELWKFITVELVPVFVANEEPPSFNFSGRDDPISQHSDGLGPIAGSSLGVGFWLNGKPFRGYVLRVSLTNYAYEYQASDKIGVFDRVEFVERRFIFSFGSYSVFGDIFTIGGGLGLGYELHQVERCDFADINPASGDNNVKVAAASSSACDDEQQIAINRSNLREAADINGFLHPVYLEGRFSLGFIF